MRMRSTHVLVAVAMATALPGAVSAEDENLRREMDEMRNMILQLQDTVQSQSSEIDQQRDVIDRAGIRDITLGSDGSASGIASFLEEVDVSGWLTFTYFHNLNDLDNDELGIPGAPSNIGIPFAGRDDNSFTFQQLWFEIGKAATPESRAGFFTEIAFGRDAGVLGNAGGFGGGDNLYLNSAYIEYLASFGGFDVTFKGGKFGTLIGYEVAQAPYNFNITRGNVYNRLQPITHVGILASTDLGNGFDVTLGLVNNPNYVGSIASGGLTPQIDGNDAKTFMGHVGYSAESWSASFNVLTGGDTFQNEEPNTTILDFILEATPIEGLTLVANLDYVLSDNDSNEFNALSNPGGILDDDDPNAWGVALTGNYDWTERLSTALRYEFVDDDGNVFGCGTGTGVVPAPAAFYEKECQIHSATGTVAYKLTNDLMIRGEVRYDDADIKGFTDDSVYNDSDGPAADEDQVLIGFEAIYQF